MDRNTLKLAAYLDEAGENPENACKTLNEHGIFYAALRHVWAGNICNSSEIGHQRLSKILSDHNISIIMIASELGNVNTRSLSNIDNKQILNVINICKYYNASMVRIFIGKGEEDSSIIESWMYRVSEQFLDNNITPLLEITRDTPVKGTSEIARLLSNFKTWKLLYDPAAIILKQNINPFIKYWTLLKKDVEVIDVRDIKIGRGFKPAGFGDSKIDITINDAISNNYRGWFVLEPSLGRKHGSAVTKNETFKHALEGLDNILDGM